MVCETNNPLRKVGKKLLGVRTGSKEAKAIERKNVEDRRIPGEKIEKKRRIFFDSCLSKILLVDRQLEEAKNYINQK